MTTGELRDRVVIQENTTTPDTQGGRSSSWGTLATVWAHIRAAGARERTQTEAIGSMADWVITIRYRADVVPSMRLSWDPYLGSAKTLQILGVQPLDGKREFMALTCGEVA